MNKVVEVEFLIDPEDGECFAYFPNESHNAELKVMYQHIGQHGSIDPSYAAECRKANPGEYTLLYRELEGLGYTLEVIEHKTFSEKLEEAMDGLEVNNFEGERGVDNLESVVNTIGYDDVNEFLQDNSGAMDVVVEWISKQSVPEWEQHVDTTLKSMEGY